MINILEPFLGQEEIRQVLLSLKKNEISTFGHFAKKFEKKSRKITNSKFNLAVNSGSVALYLAHKVCNLNSDKIVLAPSYTFVATISSIVHAGATPWLFDISPSSLCINVDQVEFFLKNKTFKKNNITYLHKTKEQISAICVVLTFSLMPDLKKINYLAKKYNLKIIIDAACAFGSKYNNKPLTKFADVVIYSFNGNKTLTSGGGGILSTDKKKLFDNAKLLANNGKEDGKNPYNYKIFGHNFKITNIHAALGFAQLKNYNQIINKKKKIQLIYKNNFQNSNFYFLSKYLNTNKILWINFLFAKNKKIAFKIINLLKKNKIISNYFWKPIHLQSFAKKIRTEKMNFTNLFWNRIIPLPSSLNLKKNIQLKIIKLINNIS